VFKFINQTTAKITKHSCDGLEFEVVRKNIKHVYLRALLPDGRLQVSSPWHLDIENIQSVIRAKRDWIEARQAGIELARRAAVSEVTNGELLPIWGNHLPLRIIEENRAPRIDVDERTIILVIRPETGLDKKKQLIKKWYARQVREEALYLIPKWESVIGVKSGRLFVQKMKSRWGSCNIQNGNIRLNSELAKFPKAALEHVVVHELVHLLEPSHSKRFYSFMDEFMPNWKELKALTAVDFRGLDNE